MTTDVAGYIACDRRCCAASLPGGFVRATDRWRVEHCLRPPGLARRARLLGRPVASRSHSLHVGSARIGDLTGLADPQTV